MAITNKTANLGLSQWEQSDAFNREDLNENFRKIEEAFGKRLELKLLRDINQPARDVNLIEVDVSDVKFGELLCFIFDFKEVKESIVRFNSSDSSVSAKYSSRVYFIPLRDGTSYPPYIRTWESSITSGKGCTNSSDINKISLVVYPPDSFKTSNTKFKIWGVG